MCGLVGYVGRAPAVSQRRLRSMRDTLTHRGPDDAGIFCWKDDRAAVGLGHRRLSIIDTRSLGRQPMANRDKSVVVAFNGELYNFESLRRSLESRHTFQTRTDTEVLLHLYEERGLDCLAELNGMFAFALWDARERRLLLARDRLGIKPLYVSRQPSGTVLFASELKALIASGVVDEGVDRQALHDYLALNYVPGPRTMLRQVEKLPPAHRLVWQAEGVRVERYWDQRFCSVPPRRRPPRSAEAAEIVLEGLRAAVARRMVADVPLGMFLSGGIDSSALLMCMAEVSPRPVKAFTIGFEEATYDESDHARVAARAFGAEHFVQIVRPDADTFIGPLVEALDEPYADSSAIPLWYLCRLARQHVTVALGGDGGDELFAGYRTHVAHRLAGAYRHLPRLLRDRVPGLVARLPVSHKKVSFDLKARQFARAAAESPARAHYGFKAFLGEGERRALRSPGAAPAPTARLWEAAFAAHPFRDALDGVLYTDFQIYLPDDILVKVDRMSMSHGLEARVPFLDHELVEAAAWLPGRLKLRGLRTKHVLKEALRGKLPASLIRRRKAGFNVPMAQWLLGPLRPLLRDMLSGARVKRTGLFEPRAVQALIRAHEAMERDHSRTLWALLVFALWNDRFRGGRPA